MIGPGLKQRLVGAVILICAGIVAWAWLFGGAPGPTVDTTSRIPTPPTMAPEPLPEPSPTRPEQPEPARIDPAPVREPDGEQPEFLLDGAGLPAAWILQVASLSSADSAERLRKRLQEAGHRATLESEDREGAAVHRVLVGPVLTREQAERIKAEIDQELDVDTLVRRFNPVPGNAGAP